VPRSLNGFVADFLGAFGVAQNRFGESCGFFLAALDLFTAEAFHVFTCKPVLGGAIDGTFAAGIVAALKPCWAFLRLAVFRLERHAPRSFNSAWLRAAGASCAWSGMHRG
jgi:hypothetical protein